MNIKFKKLNKNAVIPKRSTDGAIGYDLFIPMDMQVYQGRNVLPLNFALEMPKGVEAKIEPRSGFASKGMEGKSLPDLDGHQYTARYNADVLVGKIDPDYRGNIGVIINNHDQSFIFPKGTKVAQMTFYKVELPTIEEVDNLSDTERGEDGFGSTGTNISLHKESFYLQGAKDLLLRLQEMNVYPQFVDTKDSKVYNKAVFDEILYNRESLVKFLQGTGWRYCDHQRDKKGRLVSVKIEFNKV